VVDHHCVPCSNGSQHHAGDDATGCDTWCRAGCRAGYHQVLLLAHAEGNAGALHECARCSPGWYCPGGLAAVALPCPAGTCVAAGTIFLFCPLDSEWLVPASVAAPSFCLPLLDAHFPSPLDAFACTIATQPGSYSRSRADVCAFPSRLNLLRHLHTPPSAHAAICTRRHLHTPPSTHAAICMKRP
jgi:hypothetical protein